RCVVDARGPQAFAVHQLAGEGVEAAQHAAVFDQIESSLVIEGRWNFWKGPLFSPDNLILADVFLSHWADRHQHAFTFGQGNRSLFPLLLRDLVIVILVDISE